ncbi:unnamed protein product [Microthlaspi erraticum]|uniref:F-box protein At3g26010-like beta-propeller domain-containing protein n=1 Tax=Microthlaspi erraticum TaxID=1685480 RepID=A0A6D2JXT1_9BRAS|nr:unnamed protein product [Microthlaspi erraticum]
MPPIPPMPAPAPADSLSSLGSSTTTASVVVNKDDTLNNNNKVSCFIIRSRILRGHSSLISRDSRKEVVAHYGCETWGLTRPQGSCISSFYTEIFKSKKEEAIVLAYTDVGLILFTLI